jgi:cytochrome P450
VGPAAAIRARPARPQLIASALRDRPDGSRRSLKLEQVWTEMWMPIGAFGASGETWRRQRRMVMAGFDPAHVEQYFPSLQRVAQRLVSRWQQAARQGKSIDLQADLMRCTVDAIARLAVGVEVDTLASDEDVIQNHLNRIFPMLFKRIFAPLPTWRWWPSAASRDAGTRHRGSAPHPRRRPRADAGADRAARLRRGLLPRGDAPGAGGAAEHDAGAARHDARRRAHPRGHGRHRGDAA